MLAAEHVARHSFGAAYHGLLTHCGPLPRASCREKAAGLYSVYPYALALLLVEVPYLVVQSTVYVSIVYW